eukprot:2917304-Heterocapsa_arctica.AAC.1
MASLRDRRTAPNLLRALRSAFDVFAIKPHILSIFSGMSQFSNCGSARISSQCPNIEMLLIAKTSFLKPLVLSLAEH